RLVLRLAGAGAAAATTGVAAAGGWRLTRPAEPEFPVLDAGPGGGWLEVPLRFRPAWLPRRFGESGRTVFVDGTRAPVTSRRWGRGEMDGVIGLLVGFHPSLEPEQPKGRPATIDLNGVPGQLLQIHSHLVATYIIWQPPGQPRLGLSVVTADSADAQRDLALRVARSVVPDPATTWVGPRMGWLPADLAATPWRVHQGFTGTDWTQDLFASGAGGRQFIVSMGPGVTARHQSTFPSAPVPIREETGWQVPQMRQLFLTLPDGVEVFAQLDEAPGGQRAMPDLIRVMRELDLGPWPDMSWVGQR
ncbi:MAG TPA: hypothetical protein VES42_14780, partial [Pilimelia sp.]|nr:hypothetical protein [Pilimelia sp.]